MKKKLLFIIFAASFISYSAFSQTNNNEHLNKLIRPYLDSLRIVAFSIEDSIICLESVFPASRAGDPRFENYETEGAFSFQRHRNPNLTCYVTESIPLFGDLRIGVGNAMTKGEVSNYTIIDLEKKYSFTSKAETSLSGEKLIRQTLKVKTFLSQEPEIGTVDVEMWDQEGYKPVEIGRPVYRNMAYFKGERAPHYATHFVRDADGIYSPIDFTEGSDRTFPVFKGGLTGLFVFQIKYMEYPQEAIDKGLEGSVLLSATITSKGKIKDIKFFSQVDPVFEKEAIRLAKKTSGKWIPATRNGENIDDETMFSFQFNPQYRQTW
ncbi:MAG: energy transducer TonB [Tannerella sp.]|jgi:TonB family protein|nr:energy transducer TonB [Tannerella sp.]